MNNDDKTNKESSNSEHDYEEEEEEEGSSEEDLDRSLSGTLEGTQIQQDSWVVRANEQAFEAEQASRKYTLVCRF